MPNQISGQDSIIRGKTQYFQKWIYSAANAGDVVLATVTDNDILVKSITLKSYSAQTVDLTSAGIFGGASKRITFIPAASALNADLDAADKQIAWRGAVELGATKTIVMTLAGTGATAVDLYVYIEYEAIGDGGYLL
jgi:hypothetical protein